MNLLINIFFVKSKIINLQIKVTFKSETEIAKERKISPEERQKIINELRLVL